MQQLKHFWKDEEGATAIEYGLIAGLVSIVIIGGLLVLSPQLKAIFDNIGSAVTSANTKSQ
ncbi:hypothetical protein ASB57_14390 [Bordetella sp. N]|nr:Flp family type IVb pilin [Bordetella sp. N]ALM86980.1 hypothetical protein ASB57_14390 [Bordetella sp. N]